MAYSVCIVAYKHEILQTRFQFDRSVTYVTCAMDQMVTLPQLKMSYDSSLMVTVLYSFKQKGNI